MPPVLPPRDQPDPVLIDFIFNREPAWLRGWSTALHVFLCPMDRLSAFILPTLSSPQLALQAAAESHVARGYYPFMVDAVGAGVSPFGRFYGQNNGGYPCVEIGFPDAPSIPTPVLTTVMAHYTGTTIDINAPLLAALRSTGQDRVWVAAKWNPVALLEYYRGKRMLPRPDYEINRNTAYP